MNPTGAGYITLLRPAAMSAQGNDIYLLDTGLRRIFRYDRGQQTLTPFSTTLSAEAGISIYAAPDTSVYVTDPVRGQVLHFARDGIPLPPLISRGYLARRFPSQWMKAPGRYWWRMDCMIKSSYSTAWV